MRLEKTVDLGDGVFVKVREATVGQIRNVLRLLTTSLPELKTVADANDGIQLVGLIDQKLSVLFEHLKGIIVLPEGKSQDDLTMLELSAIWDVVVELNPLVFKKKWGEILSTLKGTTKE